MSKLIPIHGAAGKGKFMMVDDEDFDWLSKFKLHLNTTGYPTVSIWDKKAYKVVRKLAHRMILGLINPKIFVDHINHNILDARKDNLRICSNKENKRNSLGKHMKNGQVKGAHQTPYGNWTSIIVVNYEHIHIGTFYTEMDAGLAYDRAARQHFGEYANFNFPDVHDYEGLDDRRTKKSLKIREQNGD